MTRGPLVAPEAVPREDDAANARVLAPVATAFAVLLARIYVAQEMKAMTETPTPVSPAVSPAADEGADFSDADSQRVLTEAARALAAELGRQAARALWNAQQTDPKEPR